MVTCELIWRSEASSSVGTEARISPFLPRMFRFLPRMFRFLPRMFSFLPRIAKKGGRKSGILVGKGNILTRILPILRRILNFLAGRPHILRGMGSFLARIADFLRGIASFLARIADFLRGIASFLARIGYFLVGILKILTGSGYFLTVIARILRGTRTAGRRHSIRSGKNASVTYWHQRVCQKGRDFTSY